MAGRAIAAFVSIGLVPIGAGPVRAGMNIDIGVAVVVGCRIAVAVVVLPASGDRDNGHRHG